MKLMETLGSKRKTRGGGGSGQVGFRFHPTGEELVDHYLKLKKQDKDFKAENIPEVDFCKVDPEDLAPRMPSDDMEWYFFGRKDYKYKNSTRSNRTTPGGYWKITGKERVIKARRSKAVIGKKRTLTFYRRCEPKPKKSASSTNVLPKPQTDRLQSVSDEDSGASRPIKKSASSVDVDANSLQINQLAYDDHYNNERTRRRTYPTSALIALGKPNELEQQQSKAKVAAERRAAVDFPPRRNFITESNKDAEAVQGNNTEKGLKQTHNATTAGNWMSCSFISWETSPPLTSPPLVYLFNTVLGAILFFVFAREVVLYGQWC